jgi:hypothetical protein
MAGQQKALNAQDAVLKPLMPERRRWTAAEAAAGRAVARSCGAHVCDCDSPEPNPPG